MSKCKQFVLALSSAWGLSLGLSALAAEPTPAAPAKITSPGTKAAAATKPVAKPSPDTARFDTYAKPDGATYFALSLMPKKASAPAASNDIVVLFDTSASQTGYYREKALQTLNVFLSSLNDQDRVALIGADLHTAPLTEGFVTARSMQMKTALDKLRLRVPLGTLDLGVVMSEAIKPFDAKSPAKRSIVYIGDGIANSNELDSDLHTILAPLAEGRVSVDCFAIGPQLDAATLASIANQTGGILVIDGDKLSDKEVGLFLASAAHEAVVWPTDVTWPKALTAIYPTTMPPLRADRDTIVVGKATAAEPFDVQVQGVAAGKPVEMKWTVHPNKPDDENAFLAQLVKSAAVDGGTTLATLGSEGLWETRRLMNLGAFQLVKLGRQAVISGNTDQAKQLADEAARRNPSDPNAQALKGAVDKGVIDKSAKRPKIQAKGAGDLRIIKTAWRPKMSQRHRPTKAGHRAGQSARHRRTRASGESANFGGGRRQ